MEQADEMQKQINDWLHFTTRTTDTKFQLNIPSTDSNSGVVLLWAEVSKFQPMKFQYGLIAANECAEIDIDVNENQ